MKKYTILIISGCCVLAAGIAGLALLLNQPPVSESSVPEFVMPSQTVSTDSSSAPETSGSSAAVTTAPQTEAPPETPTGTAEPAALTAESPDIPEETIFSTSIQPGKITAAQPSAVSEPAQPNSAVSSVTSAPETTTEKIQTTSKPHTAEHSEPTEPEHSSNMLITSGDPLHHVQFEFGGRSVRYSGVYEGTPVTAVDILFEQIPSYDFTQNGSSFSGTLNASSLDPGYYIIRVSLDGGAIMDYVFEMTADGSAPLSWAELPADENLSAAASPLELPEEGVMQHITSSGDPETARQVLSRVRELSDEICAGITSDYDKLRAISQWVSRNMYYDKDASEKGVTDDMLTLEHVLEYHRSVCFGWSNLFSALCQAQGIWCANASGSVVTGSRCFMQTSTADERSHSWNMAVIDGRQIWVDTVWNSSNSYHKRRYVEGAQDMQYFDISTAALSQDHRVTRFEYRNYFALG